MKNAQYLFFTLIASAIILSSCHTRKVVLRGEPGEVVKPSASIADKYADIIGVNKSDIQNGRLYTFIDQWMGTPDKFGGQGRGSGF